VFLFDRYRELTASETLPDGLPAASGNAHADATAFEAWIGSVFEKRKRDIAETATIVLPALGLSPELASLG
jgi:hypothetical protein